ncbi:MAG: PEP-CTERM sorting domain-containing protein [Candidatus Pacebacteria bacterium]|nr:PEP-CTERM sorting domain-containing protein [Candidatus Paceibacterota bacterium]
MSNHTFNETTMKVGMILFGTVLCLGRCYAVDWDAGGGADQDWATPDNWSGDTVPTTGDDAYIGCDTLSVAAAKVTQAGAVSRNLYLGYNVDDMGTLTIEGEGELRPTTTYQSAYVGYSGAGTVNLMGGYLGSNGYLRLGTNEGAVGTVHHTGGTAYFRSIEVGSGTGTTGVYNLSAEGDIDVPYTLLVGKAGTGTFNQTGGTNVVGGYSGATIGQSSGGVGTVNHSAGTFQRWSFNIGADEGSSGTYNLTGSAVMHGVRAVTIGNSGTGVLNQSAGTTLSGGYYYGSFLNIGNGPGGEGTYDLGNADGTGTVAFTSALTMTIRGDATASGMFRGWSEDGSGNLFSCNGGVLTNNGQVIADGYGQDRALNLSAFDSVDNTIDNTSSNGWYAVNKGKLVLPGITVASGLSQHNWGEASEDTGVDLINSLRMEFTDVASGGPLAISLLAADRSDVPDTKAVFNAGPSIGIWDIADAGSFDFGDGFVDLTFRYNTSLFAMDNLYPLQLLHYLDGEWVDITAGYDDTHIWGNGIDRFSLFAVGYYVPEPTTLVLTLLGVVWLVCHRRRQNPHTCHVDA